MDSISTLCPRDQLLHVCVLTSSPYRDTLQVSCVELKLKLKTLFNHNCLFEDLVISYHKDMQAYPEALESSDPTQKFGNTIQPFLSLVCPR